MDISPLKGRSARKHRAILEAATELFLREGYQGTSMDQVASLAAVSKQTVYKHFAGKEQLFAAILHRITDRASEFIDTVIPALQQTTDLETDLRQFARRYLTTVLQPPVLQLRRLIIGEASRLPKLAGDYYQSVPEHTLAALSACFRELTERGLLRMEDPRLAASHFAFLILGESLDRAMFQGHNESILETALERLADAGVDVFLAAYGAS